jgi:hypothetical protein
MTFDEWVAFYNSKNPQDPFKRDENKMLMFDEDKGFCEVYFENDMVFIGQTCGDARHWLKHVEEVARKMNITRGGTVDIRSQITAYIRLFGYKVTEVINLPDGHKQYLAKHTKTGKWLRASPAFVYEDGKVAYGVTWEI